LSAGKTSPWALLERLGCTALPGELRDGVGAWTGFNTPDEYLALARHCNPAATALVEWVGESRRSAANAPAASPLCSIERTVAIGRLGEILLGAAPPGVSVEEGLASGGLRVFLAEGELSPAVDTWVPIGPGERVAVFVAPAGDPHATLLVQ